MRIGDSSANIKHDVDALIASESREASMNFFTYLVLGVAASGGMTFGLDIGTAAITSMDYFRSEMDIPLLGTADADSTATSNKITLFTVLFHVFTMIGAPFAGAISDRIGRRAVIVIACTLFTAGAIWQSASRHYLDVILGRCLGGIGNGFVLTVIPIYAAELAPERIRGKTLVIFNFSITFGIFFMGVFNELVKSEEWGWRVAIGLQGIPCIVILITTLLVFPESPRYLVKKHKDEQARAALEKLCRGNENADQIVDYQLKRIQFEIAEAERIGVGSFQELFNDFPTLLCGLMVPFCQNVTGANWFLNYGTILFNSLGYEAFAMDLVLKTLNMVGTACTFFFIERAGRKFLTLWGAVCTVTIFLIVAVVIVATGTDLTMKNGDPTTHSVQLFTLICIFLFQYIYGLTWGPPAWAVPSEVFSLRTRGKGMALAVGANMATNICFGDYGYLALSTATNIQITLFILVAANVIFVLTTTLFFQPETRQLSLEEMRKIFAYKPYGGKEGDEKGSMTQFFRRNAAQAMQILRFKPANPRSEPF
uniref:Hexose transporter 1 n=1 Tax=Mucochytrium quahogii TaxID=96639 RepID=A0A7S2S7T8_9STRA|mmetsp:Transcript_9546/g.15636  ORF Transcript_9546/g.15636 Transcript_9546/m.15636 type:complete len:539 (+) Transcript_9546:347-1963(+)|eukprot:CAMPEP_0203757380 /NCGR_PEP_ID=MMETSP0098-20131031/10470_1 /ASSEMBLY_ACC=CAM_ASM_000208 /TAXON_ID=96639 /ORGANISM=" , Strain NY0313808BC1" /LENGTH=538 /DNA_ID=CAMNT_0050649589 /DNA_START=314 /DNA_END=1930 /DNA_ORIENTATION=-